mgnify:CR=1 FL=1
MSEAVESCVKAAKGPLPATKTDTDQLNTESKDSQEITKMLARVGKIAPDFEASAYLGGTFRNITLSEFKGKWVVLCFYPGDFTFV